MTEETTVRTISLKPTARGYAYMLLRIAQDGGTVEDRKYATDQIVAVFEAAAKAGILDCEVEA